MHKRVVTEADLRTALLPRETKEYFISQNTYITPSAIDFLKDRNIALVRTGDAASDRVMPVMNIEDRGKLTFVDAFTGQTYSEKPEEMTHLRGNLLVPKTDSRIRFRGKIDSLQAKVLELQCVAIEEGFLALRDNLEEVLNYLRMLLAAEVKDVSFDQIVLLGMDESELRYVSHHVEEKIGIAHPIPSCRMGKMAIGLNSLRAQAREVELCAVNLESEHKESFIKAMNRLSSAVYIMFCRLLAENYRGSRND